MKDDHVISNFPLSLKMMIRSILSQNNAMHMKNRPIILYPLDLIFTVKIVKTIVKNIKETRIGRPIGKNQSVALYIKSSEKRKAAVFKKNNEPNKTGFPSKKKKIVT